MRKIPLTFRAGLTGLLLGTALLAAPAVARAESALSGLWYTQSGETQVRFAPCGKAICGTIAWLKTPRKDTSNPDAAKRDRSLVGTQLVYGLMPAGNGKWNGKLYNYENGKTYSGSLQLKGADKLELSGCVMGGLLCRSQTWSRAR
ncbi:MAG: DUF2147 domain-containing protein [Xanthobacter sp.]